MAYKFFYIDDTQDEIEKGTINGLQKGGEITVTFSEPDLWEAQIDLIQKTLKDYDGLILDLRLNQLANKKGVIAKYRGSSVAQELRTLAKENQKEKDYPIVLISADSNIEKSLDQTSLDLFDFIIKKSSIEHKPEFTYTNLQIKLKWLVDGYRFLNAAQKTLTETLKIQDPSILDIRFVDEWNYQLLQPVHVMARFLIKKVIDKPSFMISESLLAVRLGVNMKSEEWPALREKVSIEAKYTGAFSSTYERWYMPHVEIWWTKNVSTDKSLRLSTATERVKLISEKFGFTKLIPLTKSAKSRNESFWVLCKARHIPIDTIDGLTLSGQEHNYPWQELEYVSIDEALEPENSEVWEKGVASIEKERLKKLQSVYTKSQPRVKK
jgi:CheY-like chemotaxis protein